MSLITLNENIALSIGKGGEADIVSASPYSPLQKVDANTELILTPNRLAQFTAKDMKFAEVSSSSDIIAYGVTSMTFEIDQNPEAEQEITMRDGFGYRPVRLVKTGTILKLGAGLDATFWIVGTVEKRITIPVNFDTRKTNHWMKIQLSGKILRL